LFLKGVILVQTDTTAGFLSKSGEALAERKEREKGKEFLRVSSSFNALPRVPKKFRRSVRRSEKTTFVYPNGTAIRVVSGEHRYFLDRFGTLFSTSANISGEKFHRETAEKLADSICETAEGFSEKSSSKIIKLHRNRIEILRR
jgi:tRNA A37 threonylcarbamoyladenosine synthetase subunit TsaC/SUA5/YrdC